jgi:hypothetical protein
MESTATRTAAPAEGAVTTITRGLQLPPLGVHWVEQGGIFAGLLRAPEGDCALILCDDGHGHFEDREWGPYPSSIDGAASYFDGRANTQAMAAGGSALATEILALDVAGFKDWYLPSQAELQLARANASDHFEKGDYYWTSTQYSPYNAWVQDFENGSSGIYYKGNELRAVAVRRLVL